MFPITYYYHFDEKLRMFTQSIAVYEGKVISKKELPDNEFVLSMRQSPIGIDFPYTDMASRSYPLSNTHSTLKPSQPIGNCQSNNSLCKK